MVASTQPKEPEKKIFNYAEYCMKKGIIKRNYAKSCDTVDEVGVVIFDNEGREVLSDAFDGEIMRYTEGRLVVIRMIEPVAEALQEYTDKISKDK